MDIKNFDRFRAGSGSVSFVDVSYIGKHHESEGIMLVAYKIKGQREFSNHTIEIRVRDNQVAMFNTEYELDIPEYWRDAEVIYKWTEK